MTRERQREFVRELTENITAEIMRNAARWPEHWDGHELRMLLADHYHESATMSDGRRKADYENDRLVLNL